MSQARAYRKEIFEQFARIGKAASNPHRLELLDLLAQGPQTVETLTNKSGLSVPNTSAHLKVLRQARLVETRQQGTYVEYRLAGQEVGQFLTSLRELAQTRLTEIEALTHDFLADRDALQAMSSERLLERARCNEITVLDVRPADEFAHGHIPGARSIPLPELEKRLSELPANHTIVAYCRGPYCVLAMEAVHTLKQAGFRATRLDTGLPDWRADGRAVAEGNEGSLLAESN